ncbi:hypothetical protein NMY22_g4356 [Coprinellus aureogranulatus]|nr:hypothetical protein NMY22_g4356 [Coprinellus aureogranulatus]
MSTGPSSDPLVDDILLEVFQYLAEKSRQSFANIVAVSHVSSRWRKLAIGCPELWRRFPFMIKVPNKERYHIQAHDHKYTPEILGRCGSLSLDVGWEAANPRQKGRQAVLQGLALCHRLRSYQVSVDTSSGLWIDVENALASGQADMLEALSIGDFFYVGGVNPTALRPFRSVFNNHLPSLRTLSMTQYYVNLETLQAPLLDRVTLERGSDAFVLDQAFLRALAVHANVNPLRIRVNTSFSPAALLQSVEVTRLVEIDLSCDFHAINTFFQYVSMPRIQKVKINFHGPPLSNRSVDGSFGYCLTRLLRRLPVSSTSGPCTLSFIRCNKLEVAGVFSPNLHETPCRLHDSSANDITFIFTFPHWFSRIPLLEGVATAWEVWAERIECLELPDDPSVLSEYGGFFPELVLGSLVRVKTIICSSWWETTLVDGGLGGGNYLFLSPPTSG